MPTHLLDIMELGGRAAGEINAETLVEISAVLVERVAGATFGTEYTV